MLGNFPCFCCRSLTFFKINLFQNIVHKHNESVKRFESRSGPTFCRSWSGLKLLAKVNSRRQKSPLALARKLIISIVLFLYPKLTEMQKINLSSKSTKDKQTVIYCFIISNKYVWTKLVYLIMTLNYRICVIETSIWLCCRLEPNTHVHKAGHRLSTSPKLRKLAPLNSCTCISNEWVMRMRYMYRT